VQMPVELCVTKEHESRLITCSERVDEAPTAPDRRWSSQARARSKEPERLVRDHFELRSRRAR
jgi:hypothetical protein